MAVDICSDCGFLCEEYQLKKTKGKCPRCYPDEAKEFRKKLAERELLKIH
jgi:predicted Zn-ribbon and HTH transcriptional regulator